MFSGEISLMTAIYVNQHVKIIYSFEITKFPKYVIASPS